MDNLFVLIATVCGLTCSSVVSVPMDEASCRLLLPVQLEVSRLLNEGDVFVECIPEKEVSA